MSRLRFTTLSWLNRCRWVLVCSFARLFSHLVYHNLLPFRLSCPPVCWRCSHITTSPFSENCRSSSLFWQSVNFRWEVIRSATRKRLKIKFCTLHSSADYNKHRVHQIAEILRAVLVSALETFVVVIILAVRNIRVYRVLQKFHRKLVSRKKRGFFTAIGIELYTNLSLIILTTVACLLIKAFSEAVNLQWLT